MKREKKINYFHFAIKYRALIGYKHPFIMYHKVLIIIHKPIVVYNMYKRRCFHISRKSNKDEFVVSVKRTIIVFFSRFFDLVISPVMLNQKKKLSPLRIEIFSFFVRKKSLARNNPYNLIDQCLLADFYY